MTEKKVKKKAAPVTAKKKKTGGISVKKKSSSSKTKTVSMSQEEIALKEIGDLLEQNCAVVESIQHFARAHNSGLQIAMKKGFLTSDEVDERTRVQVVVNANKVTTDNSHFLKRFANLGGEWHVQSNELFATFTATGTTKFWVFSFCPTKD